MVQLVLINLPLRLLVMQPDNMLKHISPMTQEKPVVLHVRT